MQLHRRAGRRDLGATSTLAVRAQNEDSAATGSDGNHRGDNCAPSAGACTCSRSAYDTHALVLRDPAKPTARNPVRRRGSALAIRLHEPPCMRAALLGVLVAGCFPSAPRPEVAVTVGSFTMLHASASEASFEVVLGDREPFDSAEPCPRVDASLTARLGDTPVPLITPGGKIGSDPGDDVDDNFCGPVTLRLDGPPPEGVLALAIADSKSELRCTIPDLRATRALTLVPPASGPWQWQIGQAVIAQWSPSGDLPRWPSVSAWLFRAADAHGSERDTQLLDVTVVGDFVRFTVPSLPPGSYNLDLSPTRIARCDPGPAGLDLDSKLTHFPSPHAVTIVP